MGFVPYEVIAISNADGSLGICAAYNLGVSRSRFDLLVFLHEDVIIKISGWGNNLLRYFNERKDIGWVGVAGGLYKTKAPSLWSSFAPGYPQLELYYLVQHYKDRPRNL